MMNGYSGDILIDANGNTTADTLVTLKITSRDACDLELAAKREGLDPGDLVQRMLRDYRRQTGIWGTA